MPESAAASGHHRYAFPKAHQEICAIRDCLPSDASQPFAERVSAMQSDDIDYQTLALIQFASRFAPLFGICVYYIDAFPGSQACKWIQQLLRQAPQTNPAVLPLESAPMSGSLLSGYKKSTGAGLRCRSIRLLTVFSAAAASGTGGYKAGSNFRADAEAPDGSPAQ